MSQPEKGCRKVSADEKVQKPLYFRNLRADQASGLDCGKADQHRNKPVFWS
jgi:hypothetical protein